MRRLCFPALVTLMLACGSEHAAPVEAPSVGTPPEVTHVEHETPAVEASAAESSEANEAPAMDEGSAGVRGGSCSEDRDCNWMACGCRCRFFPRGARVRCPSCDEGEQPDCGRARCEDGTCIAPR